MKIEQQREVEQHVYRFWSALDSGIIRVCWIV